MFPDTPQYQIGTTNEFNVEGQGTAQMLLVIPKSALTDTSKAFLSKVLAAVGVNQLDEIWIAAAADDHLNVPVTKLLDLYPASKVLIMGYNAQHLGLHTRTKLYQPFDLNNRRYLVTDNLSSIQSNDLLKRQLWTALKIVFEL